jgi:uncharacterized protein (DUF58 family)
MSPYFNVRFVRQLETLARMSRAGAGGFLARDRAARAADETGEARRRDYSPGDDFRYVDWGVCARHDELVSRELPGGDRPLYILVDSSRSMAVGEPAKFEIAVRIAAALGASALGGLRRVAIATFADGIVDELPPLCGRSRLLALARFLASQVADGAKSDFARAATAFVRRGQCLGPVVVIGDFLDPKSYESGLGILGTHGHEPRMVHVIDPRDESPEFVGDVELCDAESGASWVATLDEADIERYRALFAEFCRSARACCLRRRIPYFRVRSDAPWRRIVFDITGLRISGR